MQLLILCKCVTFSAIVFPSQRISPSVGGLLDVSTNSTPSTHQFYEGGKKGQHSRTHQTNARASAVLNTHNTIQQQVCENISLCDEHMPNHVVIEAEMSENSHLTQDDEDRSSYELLIDVEHQATMQLAETTLEHDLYNVLGNKEYSPFELSRMAELVTCNW